MNEVRISPEKREELTKWLAEQPFRFASPILQFLEENEVKPETKPEHELAE